MKFGCGSEVAFLIGTRAVVLYRKYKAGDSYLDVLYTGVRSMLACRSLSFLLGFMRCEPGVITYSNIMRLSGGSRDPRQLWYYYSGVLMKMRETFKPGIKVVVHLLIHQHTLSRTIYMLV